MNKIVYRIINIVVAAALTLVLSTTSAFAQSIGPAEKHIDLDTIQAAASPTPVGPGIYDDTDPAWIYSGVWDAYASAGPYNNTNHKSTDPNAAASFTFNGTKFVFKYVKISNRGNIQVWVDGIRVSPDINANSSTLTWQAIYTSQIYSSGVHTVVFKHGGPSGSWIDVDAIQIFNSGTLTSVPPTATSVPTNTGIPPTATSTPTKTVVSPTPVGPGTYDDTDPAWIYSGAWDAYASAGPYNNTNHKSTDPNAAASFTFNGTKFVFKYVKISNRGNIQVWVDGIRVSPDINANSSTLTWQAAYTSQIYSSGVHTVVFKHGGPSGSWIDADAIQIFNSGTLTSVPSTATLTPTKTVVPPTATSTPTKTVVSPIPVGPGIYDDTDPAWIYSGAWDAYASAGPYNNTNHKSTDPNAAASFTFNGTKFIFKYVKISNRGNIQVWVDGIRVSPDINANSSTLTWQAAYTSQIYSSGVHTVVFKHGGPSGSWIDADAIQIFNSGTLTSVPPTATLVPTNTSIPPTAVSDYFVSPTGSDTNPGTQAQPWQTLTQVNNHNFLPGDVIHFQSGSTWVGGLLIDNSGLQGKPITFTTYGTGAKPIITNPGSLTNLTNAIKINADWVVVEGLMVSNAQYMGVYIANGSDNNIVRDIEAANVGIGIQIRGQHNLVTKNYIHDLHMVVNTPGGNDDYGAIGISFSDGSYNEVSYNRIVRCKVPSYDFVTDGGIVEFYGHSDSNYIHHNWGSDSNVFIEVGGGSAIDDILAYNVSVNNGHFSSIHLNDSWASVVSNFRVENNTIVENGGSGWVIFGFIGDPTSGTFSLRNNVVYVSGFQNVSNKSGFTHVNNLYYLGGGTQLGFDLGSGEVIADPLFVNLAGQDVHLKVGSPAINTGINLGYLLDFDNLPVPAGPLPDLGAFEYQ